MNTLFEWDPEKAELNKRKHGVSFELAVRAFADPFALSEQDRVENGEQRWQTLGMVDGRLLLLVAHATYYGEGDDDFVEVIRIISARVADRKERKRYEQEPR